MPGDHVAAFTTAYAADGAWGELFGRAAGFVGTELYRDAVRADRFLTIDRWRNEEDWQSFLHAFGAAYESLDAPARRPRRRRTIAVRGLLLADRAADIRLRRRVPGAGGLSQGWVERQFVGMPVSGRRQQRANHRGDGGKLFACFQLTSQDLPAMAHQLPGARSGHRIGL